MTLAPRLRTLLLFAAPAALSAALVFAPARAVAAEPADKADSAKVAAEADAKAAEAKAAAAKEDAAQADEAKADAAKADEAKADAAPKTAKVSAEAQKVIEQVDAAYSKLKSLELAGTYTQNFNAAGEEHKESRKFTASYAAPNKFRHAMDEDILVGSTGEKTYAYLQSRNLYAQTETPKERAELAKLPEPLPQTFKHQNPSLMLALVKSPWSELGEISTEIRKVDDVQLDGASFQALELTQPDQTVTLLFHPETHLLRQARADIKPMLVQRGVPDVKQALLTVDYTTVKPDASVKEDQFAWAPPQTARDIAELKDAQAAAGGEENPAAALEGKAAPAFKLKNMDDKEIALKDLKGKVVVIDIWATWCGPCRQSLPHLDKLYASVKDKGVQVYAMNLKEDKEDVEDFIKNTGLKVPVLLDTDGKVAMEYKASGIPQTVVIGKDGKVKKVIVGFGGEETSKELKAAVDAAMKG